MFGIPAGVWMAIGFAGQALFTARFLVQWLASEKKGESVVPVSFWWLSVVGSAILAFFAASRQDAAAHHTTTGLVVACFFALHFAYGIGSLWGILTLPTRFSSRAGRMVGQPLADRRK